MGPARRTPATWKSLRPELVVAQMRVEVNLFAYGRRRSSPEGHTEERKPRRWSRQDRGPNKRVTWLRKAVATRVASSVFPDVVLIPACSSAPRNWGYVQFEQADTGGGRTISLDLPSAPTECHPVRHRADLASSPGSHVAEYIESQDGRATRYWCPQYHHSTCHSRNEHILHQGTVTE